MSEDEWELLIQIGLLILLVIIIVLAIYFAPDIINALLKLKIPK